MDTDIKSAENLRQVINVASAVLIDSKGWLLLTQRPAGKRYAGWWELPGGKLKFGELPATALSREIEEELGMRIDPGDWNPIIFIAHEYPDLPTQALVLIHATHRWQGDPQSLEQQAFAWVWIEELADYQLLPTMQTALPYLSAYLAQLV